MENNQISPEIIVKNQREVIVKFVDEQWEKSIEVLMKEVE